MTELLIVLVLVLLNGFFAMSEMAMVTARRARLREMGKRSRGARVAAELSEHPEHFLATVQVGITLIGVLTGYFGGEAIGAAIALQLEHWVPAMDPYAEPIGVGLAVSLITLLSLIFGELVPKRFALTRAEKIASRVAIPMRGLAVLALPAVWLLSMCTRLVLRILRVHAVDAQKVTEEEIRLMVTESHEQGVIDADERNMMNRVLRLGDRTAESLMTPRGRIAWLDANASDAENLALMRETPFSRYPVYRESDQEVLGILEVKSLIGRVGTASLDPLRDLRQPLFVSESTPALRLLDIFRDDGNSLALVVDEYGDIQGLVTLNDLLGAVLGRLVATGASERIESSPVVQREDGTLLVDGSLSIEDLRELLALSSWPTEHYQDYNTLAGLVVDRFGRIPHPGEYFDWLDWRFEVVDLDGARIDKLLLRSLSAVGESGTIDTEPS